MVSPPSPDGSRCPLAPFREGFLAGGSLMSHAPFRCGRPSIKLCQGTGLTPPTVTAKSQLSHSDCSEDRRYLSHMVVGRTNPASGPQTCQEQLEKSPNLRNQILFQTYRCRVEKPASKPNRLLMNTPDAPPKNIPVKSFSKLIPRFSNR